MSILLEAIDLKKYFTIRGSMGGSRVLKAVDGVSLSIEKGETFGLVGESGCGKTTLGRAMIRLYDVTGGSLKFEGTDITHLTGKTLAPFKQRMQIIFQDPYSSLNPFMNVEELIGEPLDLREKLNKADRRERTLRMLQKVGMDESALEKYPHEFSGGQRQRIGIARALVVQPEFVLCDEPISALDVSIQAQVVNMLEDLQEEMGLTYLFVAHDLSMVRHISKRIAVMYLGHIVEISRRQKNCTKTRCTPTRRRFCPPSPSPTPSGPRKSGASRCPAMCQAPPIAQRAAPSSPAAPTQCQNAGKARRF